MCLFKLVYLPLAGESSDEETRPRKRKVMTKEKRKEKEVWSPSVKVGQITKREACPTRTKAKVLAVEKGLENAAAVLAKVRVLVGIRIQFSNSVKRITLW